MYAVARNPASIIPRASVCFPLNVRGYAAVTMLLVYNFNPVVNTYG